MYNNSIPTTGFPVPDHRNTLGALPLGPLLGMRWHGVVGSAVTHSSQTSPLPLFSSQTPDIFTPLLPSQCTWCCKGGFAWCCACSIAVGPSLSSFLAPWCRGTWTRAAQPLSLAQHQHVTVLGPCVATSAPGKPPRFKQIALKNKNKSQLALRKKAPKPAHDFRLQLASARVGAGRAGSLERLGVVLAPTRAFNRL